MLVNKQLMQKARHEKKLISELTVSEFRTLMQECFASDRSLVQKRKNEVTCQRSLELERIAQLQSSRMSNEFDGEWVLGSKVPMVNGFDIEVYTRQGQVRRVHRKPNIDFGSLWYSDWTHPMQNAYCSESNVKAWRVIPQTLK